MANQIVRQPNGLYAVWSSVVDDFIAIDCTPQEIIDDLVEAERDRATKHVTAIVRDLANGKKPYYQFTKSFDECIADIWQIHGADADSLKMLAESEKNHA